MLAETLMSLRKVGLSLKAPKNSVTVHSAHYVAMFPDIKKFPSTLLAHNVILLFIKVLGALQATTFETI